MKTLPYLLQSVTMWLLHAPLRGIVAVNRTGNELAIITATVAAFGAVAVATAALASADPEE